MVSSLICKVGTARPILHILHWLGKQSSELRDGIMNTIYKFPRVTPCRASGWLTPLGPGPSAANMCGTGIGWNFLSRWRGGLTSWGEGGWRCGWWRDVLGSLGQPYSEAAETRMRLLIPPAQKSHCCISGDQREPWALDFSVYFLDVKEANGTFRRYPLKRKQKRI